MRTKPKKKLSELQKNVLLCIQENLEKFGYPPSVREIEGYTNASSPSVVYYNLRCLAKMNYLEKDPGVSRGIRLLRTADGNLFEQPDLQNLMGNIQHTVERLIAIPLAGQIVASEPVPVPPTDRKTIDADSMIEVAASLLEKDTGDLFALTVKGDSMIDAMVNDGDIVILKPGAEARNGEMVAVWLSDNDETTLKHIYWEGPRVRLQPANRSMQPIYKDAGAVHVQGKVVMVIRQLPERRGSIH